MGLTYLDACLLIYAIENHPVWAEPLQLKLAQDITARFAMSPLTKMECLVKPIKTADLALQQRYEAGFDRLEQLAMPESVFLKAA